jgi:hypothetical protein
VHPIVRRSKKPHLTGYKALATTDAATICGWWERWPDASPGLVLGAHQIVLDIDRRRGGEVSLTTLEAMHTELPMSWQVATGDGFHIYLTVPEDMALI